MKKILLAFLLLSLPAFAQTVVSGGDPYGGVSGNLAVINDAVQLALQGQRWATAKFTTPAASTVIVSAQVSLDNGVNWVASPFGKRTDQVGANPTLNALQSVSFAQAQSWEVPLPANATNFRLVAAVGGTSGSFTILGLQPYVPSAPVTAVLFDTTSAVNTAIDTGTIDLSGWEFINVSYTTPAGGSGTISMVDDAGASVTMFTVPASAGAWYPFATASPSVTQVTALPATGATGALPISKRMRFQSAGVAALTSRIRIEARR